jgi:Zn-dependent protease with chaperone function
MPRKAKASTQRKHFKGIDPRSFQHPSDIEALKRLARLPGVQTLLKKISVTYTEKMFRMLNVAEKVRVSPRQCPKVYEMFRESCNVLDVAEIPEIYISSDTSANAFSFGIQKFTVTLHTGLIDLLTEDELLFVIGHEVSHIKCNHMMYRTLLYLLTFVGVQIFGIFFKVASLTFFPLEMKLRAWERKSEFSSDRGGLLVVQDPNVAQTALIKLAGTSKSLLANINVDEILKQADDLKGMDEEIFVRAMKVYHNAFRSHPFPIIRIKELHNWAQSQQYKRILSGQYSTQK